MIYSASCEYAIRGLVQMALQPAGQKLSVENLVAKEQMPKYFLAKIFQRLAQHHILESRKKFTFTIDAIAGKAYLARLSFLSPTANPLTRSFPLELVVDDPDPRMADGMTVRVKFPVVDDRKTIKVPSAWLAEENGKLGLYVVEQGKALFKQVTLGAYYDQRVEILSGLDGQVEALEIRQHAVH